MYVVLFMWIRMGSVWIFWGGANIIRIHIFYFYDSILNILTKYALSFPERRFCIAHNWMNEGCIRFRFRKIIYYIRKGGCFRFYCINLIHNKHSFILILYFIVPGICVTDAVEAFLYPGLARCMLAWWTQCSAHTIHTTCILFGEA